MKSINESCVVLDKIIDFELITSNKDLYGNTLDSERYLENVNYKNRVSPIYLLPFFNKSNIVWINSLYSIPFGFIPLLALFFVKKTKVLISPRGQLLRGAISTKKKIYLKFYKFLLKLSRHTIIVHYTHDKERINSYPIFKNFQNVIFPNPINGKLKGIDIEKSKNKKFIIGVFGRVAPIKNIEFIIRLLPHLDREVELQIHGIQVNEKYNKKLLNLIESLKVTESVFFKGDYNNKNFQEKIKDIDLVVIPSHSENFCHVFFETIEAGKLLIASDGLPWENANDYLKSTILSLEKNDWINRINTISAMSFQEYKEEFESLEDFYTLTQKSVNNEIEYNFSKLLKINEN